MPFVHAAPDVEPGVAQKEPAGHGFAVADVLPVPTQKPAAHAPEHVATVRLPALPNVPAGQGVCALAPAGQKLPMPHAEQLPAFVPPVVARNVPAAHGVGAVAVAPQ